MRSPVARLDQLHFILPALNEQRRQVIVQAALFGSGSLEPSLVKALRGPDEVGPPLPGLRRPPRPGRSGRVPLASALCPAGDPTTTSPDESLRIALSRRAVEEPSECFGRIRPARLLGKPPPGIGSRPTDRDLRLEFKLTAVPDADDNDEEQGEESEILKLIRNPLSNSNALTDSSSAPLKDSAAPNLQARRGS
jgi:hypothetical protein